MPLIAQGASGFIAVAIGGLTTYSLTTANNAPDQARYAWQIYTGALAANCTVTIPNASRFGLATNATTGGHSILLASGAGTKATLPPDGAVYRYFCDGVGNVAIFPEGFTQASIAGSLTVGTGITAVTGTFTGGMTAPSCIITNLTVTGGSAFQGTSITTLSAAGIITALSDINVGGGIAVTHGVNVSGNLAVGGTTALATTTIASGGLAVSGSIPFAASGWFMNPAGTGAFSGAMNIGVSATTDMLANRYVAASDARIKTEARIITPAQGEDWVRRVPGRVYRKLGQWEAGFFAQDIEPVSPEILVQTPDLEMPEERNGACGPAGKRWEVIQGAPQAYLAAALMAALGKIDGLAARIEALERGR
jgi:hypothetical protein